MKTWIKSGSNYHRLDKSDPNVLKLPSVIAFHDLTHTRLVNSTRNNVVTVIKLRSVLIHKSKKSQETILTIDGILA